MTLRLLGAGERYPGDVENDDDEEEEGAEADEE